jgi:hypothetical protein
MGLWRREALLVPSKESKISSTRILTVEVSTEVVGEMPLYSSKYLIFKKQVSKDQLDWKLNLTD